MWRGENKLSVVYMSSMTQKAVSRHPKLIFKNATSHPIKDNAIVFEEEVTSDISS